MIRKFVLLLISAGLSLNLCGCAVLVAGTAGGAGTAYWLTGRLSEQAGASMDEAAAAVKSAMRSLGLEVVKQAIKQDVVQFIGRYRDAKTVWVDLHRISDTVTRVEVRVGALKRDKAAAAEILSEIRANIKGRGGRL